MALPVVVDLSGLQTENRNPRSTRIDTVTTTELCRIINNEDAGIAKAVEACIPVISQAIDVLAERVRRGGRVFSIGAGTSGRLGVLDASEIPPTYSAPDHIFVSVIAGGDEALRKAKEGAEDDRSGAERDLSPYNLDPKVDSLIGIASSGRTPYVLGGLAWAKSLGCTTVGLVCVDPSAVKSEGHADYVIAPVSGPEVVTGSTRMKAGTATKMVLNMISTGIMIKLGKTFGNLMIDVKATNLKLQQRARNILRSVIAKARSARDDELDELLIQCGGSVKLAVVVMSTGLPSTEAAALLEHHHGVLARVLEDVNNSGHKPAVEKPLVLCVDGGGSSCNAVILAADVHGDNAVSGVGKAGPCNVTTVGLDASIAAISIAVQQAVDNYPLTAGTPFQSIQFSKIWIGLAGYARPKLQPSIKEAISDLFSRPLGQGLQVSTDVQLLPAAFPPNREISTAVALVAGTGSVAMKYSLVSSVWHFSGRAGGWGPLLGDDGSGFSIGRTALRMMLRHEQGGHCTSALISRVERALREQYPTHLGADGRFDAISALMSSESSDTSVTAHETTKRIAEISKIVTNTAEEGNKEAISICMEAVQNLAGLVTSLLDKETAEQCGIVLSGGLMNNEWMRGNVQKAIASKHESLKLEFRWVDNPALMGAQQLQRGST